jgi:hypothetical protein
VAKPKRCVYREGGRRCTRNGTVKLGDASVCGAHAIVFAEAAQEGASGFGGGLAQAISELVTQGRIRTDTFQRAANEVFTAMGIDPSARMPPWVPGGQPPWMPPQMPRTGQARRRVPPPIPEDELARRRARSTLGFSNEVLTVEMIKKRHRDLAKQHHPDVGGSDANMARINDAAEILLASVAA